jgi:hypothetical protein
METTTLGRPKIMSIMEKDTAHLRILVSMMGIGNMARGRVMVNFKILTIMCMRVSGKMITNMAKVRKFSIMAKNMLENIEMT